MPPRIAALSSDQPDAPRPTSEDDRRLHELAEKLARVAYGLKFMGLDRTATELKAISDELRADGTTSSWTVRSR